MNAPRPTPEHDAIDFGRAGASAQREHERRHDRREERELARGLRGRIRLAVTDDPQSTKAWAQGARGEEFVGAHLDQLRAKGACVLHDRRIPRSRANIDHIVVARSGIWVIDTKNYSGALVVRDVGGWFRTDVRLYVGGRDRTKLIAGMDRQVDAVQDALDTDTAVRAVLCFTRAEWKPFAKPALVDDVIVSRVQPLMKLILRGTDRGVRVDETARQLAHELPRA